VCVGVDDGLAVGVGVDDGLAVGVGVDDGLAVGVGVDDGLAVGVGVGLGCGSLVVVNDVLAETSGSEVKAATLRLGAAFVGVHVVELTAVGVGAVGTRDTALVTGRLAALRMSTATATPMARR
jgi:hypothetical protein